MANFCINCGTKLRKDDNFCYNCGTKIDKSDMKQKPRPFKPEMAKKDMNTVKIQKNEVKDGGRCSLSCIHCHEEFLSSSGEIEGDFCSDGIVEYYCSLGHSVALGNYCKYYE